jgi:hypothetical protein
MQLYGPNANTSIQENDISTFENFLKNPETSIPLDSNFLIAFNTIPNGIKNTFNDNEIGHYEPEAWGINVEKESLIKNTETVQQYKCLFANGVTLPSESVGQKRVGMQDLYAENSGGILSGVVSTSRDSKAPLKITFLETNVSFLDTIIRPWVVAVSHYGLYARTAGSAYDVKTTLTVNQFDHRVNSKDKIRKQYTFFDCAPISFDEITLTYGKADTTVISVNWVYKNYKIFTASAAGAGHTGNILTGTTGKPLSKIEKQLTGMSNYKDLIATNIPTTFIKSKIPGIG